VLRAGLSAYTLAPGRAGRLRELLPAGAAGQQARHDAQATALTLRLKQIDASEKNLITELDAAAGLPATAASAYRARIRERFTQLYSERETITAQLTELDRHTGQHGNDPALIDELPELAGRLDELPERIQAALFAAFDIQILWNPPLRQATIFATIFATITDTTPGIITDLLTRAHDPPTTAARPGIPATSADTSTAEISDLSRLPMCGSRHDHGLNPWRGSGAGSPRGLWYLGGSCEDDGDGDGDGDGDEARPGTAAATDPGREGWRAPGRDPRPPRGCGRLGPARGQTAKMAPWASTAWAPSSSNQRPPSAR
jgi:hypothetical protein